MLLQEDFWMEFRVLNVEKNFIYKNWKLVTYFKQFWLCYMASWQRSSTLRLLHVNWCEIWPSVLHVFGGKLFGNPRFFGREIGNWRSKKKAKLFWTSAQVLRHLLALKKSLSFALASPGKTFIFMHNST